MPESERATHTVEIRQLEGLHEVTAREWNALAGDSPFLQHAFLEGLERHDCLAEQGWTPCHVIARAGPRLVGAMLLYLRSNSYGEFVFDWAWADAYERAGGRYYPKLVSAIPFTPVGGPRILADGNYPVAGAIQDALLKYATDLAGEHRLSSFHCLFPDPPDADRFARHGLLKRTTCQYHWHNRNYRDFQDFLDSLTSRRRKEIRRERRAVGEAGITIERLAGGEISDAQWRVFYEFYCSTFHRRWGSPRMTLPFFMSLGREMPGQTLLILARRGRRYIAGAFLMKDQNALYGRHWGCSEEVPFLHFELCYYQTIELCIEARLQRLDAGVQGEHKLTRGFVPVGAPSFHWIAHAGFRAAVDEFLQRERRDIDNYIASLRQHLPYRDPAPADIAP